MSMNRRDLVRSLASIPLAQVVAEVQPPETGKKPVIVVRVRESLPTSQFNRFAERILSAVN
jgi:hypothetical protein